MAELVYDKTGRLLFTEEMKKEYTLLVPQMLPVHFGMMTRLLEHEGYKVDTLNTRGRSIVDMGQRYVHNDTCYPALLVIGQLLDAVKNGGYDEHKVALVITQTGGGCRASNYIHLLRKALEKAGLGFVPVISINFSGLEKNPGFHFPLSFWRKVIVAMLYGDIIVQTANQVRPYEVHTGQTDQEVEHCMNYLLEEFSHGRGMNFRSIVENFRKIVRWFRAVPVDGPQKVRVGVVGEIYVKYSPLGNNYLEEFLLSEGTEPVVPGLIDFILYCIATREVDVDLYGGNRLVQKIYAFFRGYIEKIQKAMISVMEEAGFRAPSTFSHLRSLVKGYLSEGNKMGEGWLLTAEMLELIHSGTPNIVCTQPFGCLPNHIVGKGMIRKLKDDFPFSNIVAIDYDPGATKINQENRIKLMLANAKAQAKQHPEETAAQHLQAAAV